MNILARGDRHPLHDQLMELRAQAIRWVAGGALVLALGILYAWAFRSDLTGLENPIIAALLAGSAGLAWALVDRSYFGAAVLLVIGLLASTCAAAILWSTGEVLYALPLILFVVPLLITYRHALLVGLGETILVSIVALLHLVALPGSDLGIVLLLIVIGAGLSWVAYQPIRTMLDWTWASYLEERRKTAEVRERQAELARLSKSLEEACERLEQANRALAEARRAAEDARRMKEEFATAISHELRTPINLIIGFSEMIAEDIDDRAPLSFRNAIETIYRNACHLSTLVDDVLDLGRLDAHRLALVKRWVALPGIVEEAIRAVQGMYDRAGIPIVVDLPAELPPLYLDPVRIRQVLINLLANAVRYVEEGYVRVSARRDDHEVIVSVEDTGIGIAPEDLPHIFERFHQTGQLRRRGGFGLGLTVSKQLIEMHAGSMWVTSEPNRGTTFFFSLPVAANVVASTSSPRLERLEARRDEGTEPRAVLVVSSDPQAVRTFQRYLDGYTVLTATTPAEVTAASRRSLVSALVVVNGLPADLETALLPLKGLPIITCSLRTTTQAGSHLGVSAFLTKPITTDQLRQALAGLRPRPRRALVVDDDVEMVYLLSRMLRDAAPRCRVRTATSGEEALALAAGPARPDLIVLDLLMPGMDGHAFIAAVKAHPDLRDIPIVVVSAATEEENHGVVGEAVTIRRAGGLTVAELMRIIQQSLDRLVPAQSLAFDQKPEAAPAPSLAPVGTRAGIPS